LDSLAVSHGPHFSLAVFHIISTSTDLISPFYNVNLIRSHSLLHRPSVTKLLGESEDAASKENQVHLQDAGFQVHLTSSKSQTEVLAELASEEGAVKVIIPLDDLMRDSEIVPTSEEKTLLSALESLDELDGDTNLQLQLGVGLGLDGAIEGDYDVLGIEDVDGLSPEEVSGLVSGQDTARGPWWTTIFDKAKRPILISAGCAGAALLAFLCTVTALYAIDFLKKSLFASRELYDVLPGVEKGELGGPQEKVGIKVKKLILDSSEETKKEEVVDEKGNIEMGNTPPPPSDGTALPPLPYPEAESTEDSFEGAPEIDHDDPDLLPLPDHDNQESHSVSSRRSMNYQIRERTSTNIPPSWSIRASESQPLSIPGAYVYDPLPLPFSEARTEAGDVTRRQYNNRNPEIDIALAMQLRPGLGDGADAAWLVRFLMGIFGWVTVMVSGNGR
jgi:hypothetical protein